MIAFDVDKAEWLEDVEKGDSSLKTMVEESINERERMKFVKGLNRLTL